MLFVYGNYAGDNLNFDLAEQNCRKNGIETRNVRVWDDILSASKENKKDRRGIAGNMFVVKIAGAAADDGLELEEVTRITEKARDNVNSIGLATRPGLIPGNETPPFILQEDEMEYGVGIHGEPGVERTKIETSDKIVERMYKELKRETNFNKNDEICVLINGLGSSTLLELYIAYYNFEKLLKNDQIIIHDVKIGNFCTCMEMGGFSISIFKLDEELKKYYDFPCCSPYLFTLGKPTKFYEDYEDKEDYKLTINSMEDNNDYDIKIYRSTEGVIQSLNYSDTKNMILYITKKIIENKSYLTEVDSKIGDGDHGIGMYTGMKAIQKEFQKLDNDNNVYKLFEIAGNAMIMSMGGASGVIFGSLFLEGSKNKKGKSIGSKEITEIFNKSLEEIKKIGKAEIGDKTMVDALEPAVNIMKKNINKPLVELLIMAEKESKIGLNNTKNFVAKHGRAKSLGERSIGYQDAGATSVYLIIKSMREYVEGKIK